MLGDPGRLRQRHGGGQELHLGARHQDLADLPLPGVENLAHDVPLVGTQGLVTRDQVAQLLVGHDASRLRRIAAE